MKRFILVACIIALLIIGCNKRTKNLVDDTWYIVDNNAILMLCDDTEQENYIEIAKKLKGNGEVLKETIQLLTDLEPDAKTKNALGIAYLRLRLFNKAERCLKEALELAHTDDEKACILSNLSEIMIYKNEDEVAIQYAKEAFEKKVDDPVRKLALHSNLVSEELPENERYVHDIVKVKGLLKEERKLLGSNQFIGIFNYKTLARACYLDNNMKKCEYYINKALKINSKMYQYRFIDTGLNQSLALAFSSYDLNKALEYSNKSIEIMEEWQSNDHYDLLNAYAARGNIYLNLNYRNAYKAAEDYQLVIDRCTLYEDIPVIAYYNLANAYRYMSEQEKEIESYAKAYYLGNQAGWKKLNQDIESALRELYKQDENKEIDFDSWFQKKLNKAEEDLKDTSGGKKD